jgi:hypothetical protein
MPHPKAVTVHLVADNDTFLEVEAEEGLVPVAIYAEAWTPTGFTLSLPLANSGLPGATVTYKETDDSSVTLTDDKWSTIPEVMGRKCAAVKTFRLIFQATETGGPFDAYIAWAPLGGA